MDQDRFDRLVETYGAAPWRWPEADREAATRFAQGSPEAAETLALARALDDALDLWSLDGAPAALRERIVAAAPGWRTPLFRRPRVWWAGAGLAAACGLGMLAGAVAAPSLLQPRAPDPIVAVAALGDSGADVGPALDLGGDS